MNYQALGLGEAASVVTAVHIDKHTITITFVYDPQSTQMPYTLCFTGCEQIVWQTFETSMDLPQFDAELVDLSCGMSGAQQQAFLTTDMFELSFVYKSFFLQTPTSISYSTT